MTGRPVIKHPTDPPCDNNGEINFETWEKRLREKGVRGLPHSELVKKINQARVGNYDIQAELRLAERYADTGYEVEIVRPTSETPAGDTPVIDEPFSPDLRVRFPEQAETARVDVKFREPGKQITKSNLNKQIDKANNQIKQSKEGNGDIIIDGSLARSDGLHQADVERYLNGKMKGNRFASDAQLRNIDYLEIIYPETVSNKTILKRSFMVRTADGNVNGSYSEILK
ncbi:hypothetical protein NIES4071_89360 [Calothrix sp. NIES-4071]|nr:hypothetical protein NIES4071_89360 [Calothrix sp. NIES-4071]BAZ63203.1 hypothetical protein NIES4105_89290 [Calothrix sp. NIES-4105]